MIEQALKFLTEQALKNQVPTVDKRLSPIQTYHGEYDVTL